MTARTADTAGNIADTSEISFNTASVFIDLPPTAPGPLTASANPTRADSVSLFWGASTDDVSLVRYEVLRDGALIASLDLSVTTFSDVGLGNGQYEYRVRAIDSAGHMISSDPLIVDVDRTAPVLNLPGDSFVDASNGADAAVGFVATAIDNTDPAPVISCAPGPGVFAIGVQDITCTATDRAGNAATGSFTVTVRDVTAPVLSLPDPIVVDAETLIGARVAYTARATDNHDLSVVIPCSPASGSTFGAGQTLVSCSAVDLAGNRTDGSFTVFVRPMPDGTPPAISVLTPALGATYAINQLVIAAYSCSDESGVAVCAGPAPAGTPLDTASPGPHVFTVTARDTAGNTSIAPVTYTVIELPSITIAAPAAVIIERGSVLIAQYACQHAVSCVGDVPNGSPIETAMPGAKSFTVTAKDAAGNTTTETVPYVVSLGVCVTPLDGLVAWLPGDGSPDELVTGGQAIWTSSPTYAAGQVAQGFAFGSGSSVSLPIPRPARSPCRRGCAHPTGCSRNSPACCRRAFPGGISRRCRLSSMGAATIG